MTGTKTIVRPFIHEDIPRRSEATTPATARRVGEELRVEVDPELVRIRAYEIFEARNGAPGDAESDWFQAERELADGGEPECRDR